MKYCNKCQAETERNKFGVCRPCLRRNAATFRIAHPLLIKEQSARYYLENKEKEKAKSAKYREDNPEKYKEAQVRSRRKKPDVYKLKNAIYYQKNKDAIRERQKRWIKENADHVKKLAAMYAAKYPEKKRISEHNRRAQKVSSGGKLTQGLGEKLYKLQKGKCACCNQALGDDYHLDHIVPLALGGANEDWNIQLLRPFCNMSKHAKHPIDFMQQRGFLL